MSKFALIEVASGRVVQLADKQFSIAAGLQWVEATLDTRVEDTFKNDKFTRAPRIQRDETDPKVVRRREFRSSAVLNAIVDELADRLKADPEELRLAIESRL